MHRLTSGVLAALIGVASAQAEGLRIGVPDARSDADIAAAQILAGPEDTVVIGTEACLTEIACLDALRSGALDVVSTSSDTAWHILPAAAAFELPQFLTPDTLRRHVAGLPRLTAQELEVIAATPNGMRRVIATTSRRITHPDDMAGLRFYAPDATAELLVIAAGGEPVDLPRSAVFDALQVGDLDGVIVDISDLMRSNLVMAGVSYATIADHAVDLRLWWARRETPGQALRDAGHASVNETADRMFRAARQATDQRNVEAFEDFIDAGGDLHRLTDEGRAAFLALMASYHDAMRRQYPEAGPLDDQLTGRGLE